MEQETQQPNYEQIEKEIHSEIISLEYFIATGLMVSLFKHSQDGKDSTCIKVTRPPSKERKKESILYVRYFDGYTPEIRYLAYFYLYKDLMNQGLMFMNQLSIEQDKLDEEKNVIEVVGANKNISNDKGKKIY